MTRRALRWRSFAEGWLAAEGLHLAQDGGGLGFEGVALAGVVVFRIFAGAELEVEVAEVVVDDVLALAEVVEARFFYGRGGAGLRPEDEGGAGEEEDGGGES